MLCTASNSMSQAEPDKGAMAYLLLNQRNKCMAIYNLSPTITTSGQARLNKAQTPRDCHDCWFHTRTSNKAIWPTQTASRLKHKSARNERIFHQRPAHGWWVGAMESCSCQRCLGFYGMQGRNCQLLKHVLLTPLFRTC